MIAFEAAGNGTFRFDALFGTGRPHAIVFLRTRINVPEDVQVMVEKLFARYASAWVEWVDGTPCIRFQVQADAHAEGSTVVVMGEETCGFEDKLLEVYCTTVDELGPSDAQPPISHDVCFLPSGRMIHYEARK